MRGDCREADDVRYELEQQITKLRWRIEKLEELVKRAAGTTRPTRLERKTMNRNEAIEDGDFARISCRECDKLFWSDNAGPVLCESCRIGFLNQQDVEDDEQDKGGEE